MTTESGFPYSLVQFNKEGKVHDEQEVSALLDSLEQVDATDLIVLSHGWNNSMPEAEALYSRLLKSMRDVIDRGSPAVADRRFAVLGVLWPSKKFADADEIASGAAGFEDEDTALRESIDNLKDAFEGDAAATLEGLKDLVPGIDNDPAAQHEFVERVKALLTREEVNDEDASDAFFSLSSGEILDRLSPPSSFEAPARPSDEGGAAAVGMDAGGPPADMGGAASFFSSAKKKLRDFINLSTYFEMKGRAGLVGRTGVSSVIRRALAQRRQRRPILPRSRSARCRSSRLLFPITASPKTSTMTATASFAASSSTRVSRGRSS
jgi:hypothetical protein